MATQKRLISVLQICSFLTILYSFTMIPPICVELIYRDGELAPYLISLGAGIAIGITGWLPTIGHKQSVRTRDGFLVVVLFWVVFSLMSALPFVLFEKQQVRFVDAMFEGISGITTTGASIFPDMDTLPHSINYYRAQLHFFGGLGIIVLAVAILPLLGIGGAKIYQSETPGPFKEEKLTPRLADTAKILWVVYATLAMATLIALKLAGMDWFDAICHSFSIVSLGGFSTHTASLSHYNNHAIEYVAGVFMLLSAANFALYYKVFERKSLVPLLKNIEYQFFLRMVFIVGLIASLGLYTSGTFSIAQSVIYGYVQTISIITSAGLALGNYPSWPGWIVTLLILASFVGGCVGSTSGGLKAMRALLLYRQSMREIKQLIHPRALLTVNVGGMVVPDRAMQAVYGFFFLYVLSACFFLVALMFTGLDLQTAFGTMAACLNNMGVGDNVTAATFGTLSDTAKWLMCVAMILGRLEVFPVLVLFSRAFWRF